MRIRLFLSLLVLCPSYILNAQTIAKETLPFAHSHNDYNHGTPLWDALANGCTSIEIDVFNFKDELKVAHVNLGLKLKPNLNDSYLNPLFSIIQENGSIYPSSTLVLMIDFKTSSHTTLPLLLDAIKDHKAYFSYYHNGRMHEGPLKLVISGSGLHQDQIKDMDSIYVFKDGSVTNCEQDMPAALIPRGSASYGSQFKWIGKGSMPQQELEKLRVMIQEAKHCNKKLRFYAMPEKENIWRTFLNEGVEWINVNNLSKYNKFYQSFINKKVPN